jgi:hypothetical protein
MWEELIHVPLIWADGMGFPTSYCKGSGTWLPRMRIIQGAPYDTTYCVYFSLFTLLEVEQRHLYNQKPPPPDGGLFL